MEFQSIANGLVTAALLLVGWVGKSFYAAIRSLEDKHEKLALRVANDYVNKDSLQRLEDKVDRVLDKLDRKVDK